MSHTFLPLLLATAAVAGVVPRHEETAAHVLQGRGLLAPIATDSAAGIPGGEVATDGPPVSSFFAGLNPPFPTNLWWASYAATPGTDTASGPFPYESNLDAYGINFGVSTDRQWDGTSIKQPTQIDWHASFVESSNNFANHKATAFDTHSVTVQFFLGASTMTTYLVPGSPYLTFEYNDATPLLTSQNGTIATFNGQTVPTGGSVTVTGTEFTVTNSAGGTYIVYSLSTITLTASNPSGASSTIQASGQFNGVIRVVMLPQASYKALLDQYYQTYPTSVGLDYSFTDTTGTLIFNWDVVGNGADLLLLTWPHHRLSLQNPNNPPQSSLAYLTTKGYMYPTLGDQWQLLYDLTSITWDAPRPVDSSCLSTLIQGLEYEINELTATPPGAPGDFYYWGGTYSALGRLALIADNIGREDLVTPVINYLIEAFQYWFDPTSTSTVAAYETTWGGVVDKAGATDVNIDFGNGYYNDHHFHYGYYLHVAAIIAKFNSSWLDQHRDYINFFARDIANPSPQDPYFPVTRCRDWFAGHSWASGIANGAGSRDQESTGEAINGYYGFLLWASVTLSQDYVNYARLLLATEQQGAQVYWHLYPDQSTTDPNNPYPEQYVRELITIGNVEDWQSGAWLFWGAQRSEIAAIQMLPVTPVNEVLYDSDWVENVWTYTADERADPTVGDEWKVVILDAYSNANPQDAAVASASMTSWGTGTTFTNTLYFLSTRNNPTGQPICSALPSNPYGTYTIQSATTGQYVAASSANTNLVANANAAGAAVFSSAYAPNAGTLQLTSTEQFVTADISGDYALAAIRGTASTWEQFTIRQKVGAAAGVYSILATSNSLYVTLGGDGSLINNGATEADSAGFYFIQA